MMAQGSTVLNKPFALSPSKGQHEQTMTFLWPQLGGRLNASAGPRSAFS